MKKNLFITGSSGFIGSNLIKRMNPEDYKNIYCLSRREAARSLYESLPGNIRFIKGDILKPEAYERYLAGSDIVIHLAALTGKAPREEYFRINSEGTRVLTEQCRNKGIKRFIFISSIAADFRHIEGYHYAQSKIEAEKIVKTSGVPYTILRPTIVIGNGSPILNSLLKLAKAPIVPIFGDGSTKIQPVYIDDLIECILNIIDKNSFINEILTVAGPERTTIEEFIKTLHKLSYEKKLRLIHLPVRPIAKILLFLEKYLLPFLPFTAGQLASFTNDGISESYHCQDGDNLQLKNIDEMLRLSLSSEAALYSDSAGLKKECRNFTKYLIEYEPDRYIQSRYIQGHKITGMDRNTGSFDILLVKAANRNKFLARLADTYTSVFYKNALLRKKLLLLLALLESCGPTYRHIDTVNEHSTIALYTKAAQKAAMFLLTLLLSGIVFVPLKLLASPLSKGKSKLLT